HLLDPQYYDQKLTTNSMLIITQFVQKYYSDNANIIWQQLIKYKTEVGNFETLAPELCKVATQILAIPSSLAASEHNWSAFYYIQEKKRARLTNEQILKLVYIYSNYKLTYIELLDLMKDDSSDLYKEILLENESKELFKLDAKKTNSETDSTESEH
ncbi:23484_t:CDS:2, partial [Cetraspora pellucida]